MKAQFSALSKTISDLVPSALYIPQNYCSKLYTVSPHYIPSCHTAAKSAYLQTMSINSDTRRISLRHRNTILCAHNWASPGSVLAHSSYHWPFLSTVWDYNFAEAISNKEFACIQSFGSSVCKLHISYMVLVDISAGKSSWPGLLCWCRYSLSFPLQESLYYIRSRAKGCILLMWPAH